MGFNRGDILYECFINDEERYKDGNLWFPNFVFEEYSTLCTTKDADCICTLHGGSESFEFYSHLLWYLEGRHVLTEYTILPWKEG